MLQPLFLLQRGEGLEGLWAEDSQGREGKAEEEGLRVEVESRRSRSFMGDFHVRGEE